MDNAQRQLALQRLQAFFQTFKPGEPLAVTRQRRDLVKGFVDRSEEGNSLIDLLQMNQMAHPRELFGLYDDGFHTPAMKQPHHPSFMLNDPRKQAIARMLYPEQRGIRPNRNAIEQLLEILQARKK